MKVGPSDTYIDPGTGRVLYQGPYAQGAGELGATLDGDAQRYLATGTLPPNMGRGMQGAAQATAIRQRAAQMAEEQGIDPATLPAQWAQFKAQKGYTGEVDSISGAIQSGDQPPILTGLYGMSGPIRQTLAESGFDLSKAQLEWTRAQKQIQSLNGPQMTRFVGLAQSVTNTIDNVRDLAGQMNQSGVPALNQIELAAYVQANGNSPKGQLAAQYLAGVNTLKEEFANLANGGYAPTEAVWKLANSQINGNYGVKELNASLDEIQRLIKYRVNAVPGLSTIGPGAANIYLPNATVNGGEAKRQAPSTGMPQAPAPASQGLPAGWSVQVH